jgi:DMSO/TMAO reductase YedYZ molybdopterin-dependent catalytic subunit
MSDVPHLSRRGLLQLIGAAAAVGSAPGARAQGVARAFAPMPPFTGPEANPHWTSVAGWASYPEKLPLLQLTDRPVQLETPRAYFDASITPNAAFYVRWHLDGHPEVVDLATWRLQVDGHVEAPLRLSYADLMRLPSLTVTAVNQCSGNSRSRMQPRVPGSQWGNGAMGCARWTGVRLTDVLRAASPKPGAQQVQLEGGERGKGPEGRGAFKYAKALDLASRDLQEVILAYAMNGAPLPLLNGFPLRAVVPGYFATYWVKALGAVRVLNGPDDNFWMKKAYLIPDTPRGHVTPEMVQAGSFTKVPLGRMPVRSFIVAPDGGTKLPPGLAVAVRGIAFSGRGAITRVEVSADDGQTWQAASLGPDEGRYAFRLWSWLWRPTAAGRHVLAVRATDASGDTQSAEPLWNPSGYAWNCIERQPVVVGEGA